MMATIYVENASNKHSVQITSAMTAADVVRAMRKADQLQEDDPTWTIFELINDFSAGNRAIASCLAARCAHR